MPEVSWPVTTGMRELKSPSWMCKSVPQMPQDLTRDGRGESVIILVGKELGLGVRRKMVWFVINITLID